MTYHRNLPFNYDILYFCYIYRFVAFSRMPTVRTGRLVADKAVVFAESLIPSVFFREMKLKLPIGVPTEPLDSLKEVSQYLQKIHRLAFCKGTGLQDPLRSMKCRIYVDMPSSVRRCTACSSQHQTVLHTAEENKTWKYIINFICNINLLDRIHCLKCFSHNVSGIESTPVFRWWFVITTVFIILVVLPWLGFKPASFFVCQFFGCLEH